MKTKSKSKFKFRLTLFFSILILGILSILSFNIAYADTYNISLSWTSSTDNVAVIGYKIYRNGIQIGTSGTNSYSDTGLPASMTYLYTVSAYDANSNESVQSSSVSVTTPTTTTPTNNSGGGGGGGGGGEVILSSSSVISATSSQLGVSSSPATATFISNSKIISVTQSTTPSITPSSKTPILLRDLKIGISGEDVRSLQKFLNTHGFVVSKTGPGSFQNESILFGALTKKALILFQKSSGITPAEGYFGTKTRAKVLEMLAK